MSRAGFFKNRLIYTYHVDGVSKTTSARLLIYHFPLNAYLRHDEVISRDFIAAINDPMGHRRQLSRQRKHSMNASENST
jgi:hypothetical protein